MNLFTQSHCVFFPDRTYRYVLRRTWAEEKHIVWIMLNPSTADEEKNDPTIERVERFSRAWGCGGYTVLNLFAIRSTDPTILYEHPDPIGPENDHWIKLTCATASKIIVAWGVHSELMQRQEQVCSLLTQYDLYALWTTKDKHPGHPLYLPSHLIPVIWREKHG